MRIRPSALSPGDAVASGEATPEPLDTHLVALAQAGERAAFELLLRRHYDAMHRVAWRMTGSRTDAEDIVQEVCCTLADRLAGFRGECRVTTWLTGIVVNACRDQYRRGATLARLKAGLAVLMRAAAPEETDPYRRIWLESALGRLDPRLRETLVLVAGEGLTHAEAGRALGIAEATVSWRMHEARRRLAGEFERSFEGERRHG
ncbi:UNVERIFIED_CONTAM: RNA polymerase sigma factor [Methylobacteriaceae bacterium AG10]|nr:RNA polymerase sigma factor [Methylobacteriaceae bacterium AG10]